MNFPKLIILILTTLSVTNCNSDSSAAEKRAAKNAQKGKINNAFVILAGATRYAVAIDVPSNELIYQVSQGSSCSQYTAKYAQGFSIEDFKDSSFRKPSVSGSLDVTETAGVIAVHPSGSPTGCQVVLDGRFRTVNRVGEDILNRKYPAVSESFGLEVTDNSWEFPSDYYVYYMMRDISPLIETHSNQINGVALYKSAVQGFLNDYQQAQRGPGFPQSPPNEYVAEKTVASRITLSDGKSLPSREKIYSFLIDESKSLDEEKTKDERSQKVQEAVTLAQTIYAGDRK